MNGIFYFSSTGNSLWVAKRLQDSFGGDIFYIPKYMGTAKEFEKIFIATPIYSFGMPKHVYQFLLNLDKSVPIFVVQTYGGMIGGADTLMWQICKDIGLNIQSVHVLKMPENFTLSFSPPKFYTKLSLKKANKRLFKIVRDIETQHYRHPKNKKTKQKTWLKNMQNWHIIGQRFCSNENCIKCGKCIKLCPSGNICFDENGKIVFKDKCVACLGCYHRCPTKAIVYLNKKKKYRYINPNINEAELGKNISQKD